MSGPAAHGITTRIVDPVYLTPADRQGHRSTTFQLLPTSAYMWCRHSEHMAGPQYLARVAVAFAEIVVLGVVVLAISSATPTTAAHVAHLASLPPS